MDRNSIRFTAPKPENRLTAGRVAIYFMLVSMSVMMLVPLIWLVCACLKRQEDLYAYMFLPLDKMPTLNNFVELFEKKDFGRVLLNSFFLTSVSTSVGLILASMGGYALAKFQFKGKNALMLLMLATMMIPHSVLVAPLYELICHMGLMNNYLAILVPGAVSAFGMLLFRQAMVAVPDDLIEAARIDGCNEFQIYWRIVMPVVRPMSGAFCLMAFMGTWNSFLWPMIVLQSDGLFTAPIVMNQMVGIIGDNQYGMLMAGTFLGVLPPAVLFFILQKEFIAGLTAGAVKG
jgi:multiple sugar transport system permease protein